MSNVLLIAEHDGDALRKANWPVLTFAKQAADIMGGEVIAAVFGGDVSDMAKVLAGYDVAKVVAVSDDSLANYLPGEMASAVAEIAEEVDAELVVSPATFQSNDFMPRVAVRLEAAMITNVGGVLEEDDELMFKRPMWAGKLIEVVQPSTDITCVTVRSTDFDASEPTGSTAPIDEQSPDIEGDGAEFVSFNALKSERPELSDADVVISGGRGLRTKEGFQMLDGLADLFNAAIGATRAAVDAGMCANDLQVGQTGKVVAPDLYIAVAISGAIQHLAGMKSSKTIVVINKDPEAPIFQVADYGLVADAFKAVPELTEAVKVAKG